MQTDRFYVYEHLSADSGAVFYVGKGTGQRAYLTSRFHRNQHWTRHVEKHGGFNVRFVASAVPEELAFLVEMERIDQLRRQGAKLCNQTDGGDGTAGWVKSEEWRKKVGAAHRGKSISSETRKKISATLTGFRHSDEAKANMSASRLGLQNTLGRRHSAETKRKMSVARVGNKSRTGQLRSETERAKQSAAMKGKVQGDRKSVV